MTRKVSYIEKSMYLPLSFVLFGMIFARYCYYGFEYFYQLDDYIQYHNYRTYGGDLWGLVKSLGMLSSRPLAGIMDIFVWSEFYGCMIAAVAIISALYMASAIFFHMVFSKHFGTGYMFFVIYALLPLGFEGTYWISASSRIVVGAFFASLSLLFFDEWCEKGGKSRLAAFSVFQFIAFCFYEQVILLSGAATFAVMLCHAKKRGRERMRWGLLMFPNAAIYFTVTKIAPSGVYGQRAELFLPWKYGYKDEVFTPLLNQIKEVFIKGNAATLSKGLVRGFKLLVLEPNLIYVLIVLALCFSLYMIVINTRRENISFFAELFTGLFLAVAPLLIFFILKKPWFGLRNAVPSFCGLALMADALSDLVFGRVRKGNIIYAAFVVVLTALFCTASVSELHDYRETTEADTKIASAAAEAIEDSDLNSEVWLLNVDASYVKDGNFYFHEHDYGVTSSSWALTGAVRAISGRGKIPQITPVSVYRAFETDEDKIAKANAFWYDGMVFTRAVFRKSSNGVWSIFDKSGKALGTMSYSDGAYMLKAK